MLLHDKGENAHDHNRACYHDRKLPPLQQSISNHKYEDHGDMKFFKSAQYQDHAGMKSLKKYPIPRLGWYVQK